MAKNVKMNQSVSISPIEWEEAVINYHAAHTSNTELLNLAIQRIVTYCGGGSVQNVDNKVFIHTADSGEVNVYSLVDFGDVVALNNIDDGVIIMLCENENGVIQQCEPLDIPTALVLAPKDNETEMNDVEDVPTSPVIIDPISIAMGAIKGKLTPELKPIAEASEPKDSYDLHIHLHMSKAGETKTYKVFGTGYKNIPQSIRDKFYPGGKGKKINVWNFWSRKRFDDNGGIDALRAALPNMKIEFIDVATDHIAPIIEEPAAEPIVEPAVIVTEEGAASATFPEVKPIAESNAVTKPTVKRGRKPKANAPKSEVLAPKSNGNGKAKVQPDHIHFNDTDKTKIQCIMRKALTKCGNAAKSKVEFFMTAGSNSIVVSIYNDKGQKAKAGTYAGLGWLKMGEGNKDDNNQLVRSLSMISKEFLSIVDENWDGKVA